MSIRNLQVALKQTFAQRINEESQAKRGYLKNGQFIVGNEHYKAIQVVDCNTSGKVWGLKSSNNSAIIIGN